MTAAEILREVGVLAADHLDIEPPILPEMTLVEDLDLDSLKLLTLAVQVENRFEICLGAEDEEQIRTVSDLVSMIEQKLNEKQQS